MRSLSCYGWVGRKGVDRMAKDARGRELPKGIRQRDNGTFEGRVAVDGKRVSVYGNTVTEVKRNR